MMNRWHPRRRPEASDAQAVASPRRSVESITQAIASLWGEEIWVKEK